MICIGLSLGPGLDRGPPLMNPDVDDLSFFSCIRCLPESVIPGKPFLFIVLRKVGTSLMLRQDYSPVGVLVHRTGSVGNPSSGGLLQANKDSSLPCCI